MINPENDSNMLNAANEIECNFDKMCINEYSDEVSQQHQHFLSDRQ